MRNFARLGNRVQWCNGDAGDSCSVLGVAGLIACGASDNVDAQLGRAQAAGTSARTSRRARSIRRKFTMGFEPDARSRLTAELDREAAERNFSRV